VKVAHVVMGGDVAGGQIVALQLAQAAHEAGHEAVFVSPSEGPFTDLVRAAGLPVHILRVGSALDQRALLGLLRLLRVERVDLVHTHGHFAVNVLARIAGRLAGARVLSHMHIQNAFRHGPGRRAQIAFDNATARLCFALVAVSDATRADLLRQGYPADRLVTIRNGIDPAEDVAPVRLADGPTIVEVARLAEVKGQRVLLAALQQVDATAVLVGRDLEQGGAYEDELRADAERLGVAGRVVFAGYRNDVPAVLAGCDVFCLPSFAEGLPLVVLEAMAHAKPVVATRAGGTDELVVDRETGLLVPTGDADSLARALSELLADPTRATRMGEAGRARVVAEFGAAAMAERVLELYDGA